MSNRKFAIATAVAAAAGFSTAALADDTSVELDALKARIAEIETQQHQAAINATVIDAQGRNELLKAEGFVAGWDNGFKLGSGDGKYMMNVYGLMQFRNITTATNGFFLEDHDDGETGETVNGFEMTRAQIGIRGNVVDERLGYNMRWDVGSSGAGDLDLAYITWRSSDEWTLKAGQYKGNWSHEESTADWGLLAVDRSLLNATWGGANTSFVQGVAAMYGTDQMRAEIGFTDAAASANTPWNGEEPTGYDFGVQGRFEFKFGDGDWMAYDDMTALGNKNDLFVIGAGFDYSAGSDNAGGDGFDLRHTVDVQWENTTGLALYGALVANHSDNGDDTFYNWGAVVQVGYLIGDSKWEVFGRYSYSRVDEVPDGVEDEYHELTGGVNYYFFNNQNFKFSMDLNYLTDGAFGSRLGELGYVADDEEQWSLRAQLQLQI